MNMKTYALKVETGVTTSHFLHFDAELQYDYFQNDDPKNHIQIRIEPKDNLVNQVFIEWVQSERNGKRFYGNIEDFNAEIDKWRIFDIYPDIENIDNGKETNGLIEWHFKFGEFSDDAVY